MDEVQGRFLQLVVRHLGRPANAKDGFGKSVIERAERRLGLKLPRAVEVFYRSAGRNERIAKAHNTILDPEEMFVDSGFLIFMEENQVVVRWGIKLTDVSDEDPEVWQIRASGSKSAFSEKMKFSEFIVRMLDWQAGIA